MILYTDDTSGNKSKKWNKFDIWCLVMAGLPLEEARKFSNINYLTSSNLVSALEMTCALQQELRKLEDGIVVYDSLTESNVLALCPLMCVLCDNARASEILNHVGATGIRFCRKCMVRLMYCL